MGREYSGTRRNLPDRLQYASRTETAGELKSLRRSIYIIGAVLSWRGRPARSAGAILHDPRMDNQPVTWDSGIKHAAISDVGLRRSNNQDSFAVALAGSPEFWARRGHLFMVADGMGAHAAGELASKMATDSVPHTYHKLIEEPPAERHSSGDRGCQRPDPHAGPGES